MFLTAGEGTSATASDAKILANYDKSSTMTHVMGYSVVTFRGAHARPA